MKKLLMLTIALFMGAGLYAQSDVETYFEKYEDNPDFSTVYVSPKMFSMITKGSEKDLKDLEVLKDLKGLTVLSTKKEGLKYYKEAQSTIKTKSYDELVKVRDNGQKVNIFTKASSNDDIVKEVLILVGEPNNFTLVSFIGNIKLSDLSKLADKMDIQGAEHLNKIGK